MSNTRILAALAVAALIVAGAACQPDDEEDLDLRYLQELEADIDALIAAGPCTGGGDCRSVAFGAKPCGGPWSYKIYAASQVDSVALAGKIAFYNALNAQFNQDWGWASNCEFVNEPAVGCVEGTCQVVIP